MTVSPLYFYKNLFPYVRITFSIKNKKSRGQSYFSTKSVYIFSVKSIDREAVIFL
jgi:hypothetical protein